MGIFFPKEFLYVINSCLFCITRSKQFYVFFVIFVTKTCFASHFQYESCLLPVNCTNGPSITFPFYITGHQESYCGYPGFGLNCTENGDPSLRYLENDYIIEDIFYQNRSLKLYNSAVLGLSSNSCVPQVGNTTFPVDRFRSVRDELRLHLFSNCSELFMDEQPLLNRVNGCVGGDRENWELVFFDDDEGLRGAFENCRRNVFSFVERRDYDDYSVVEILRKGFFMNWISSDCFFCEESGGRCGFNETAYHFRCFCPDRPHSGSCPNRSGTSTLRLLLGLGAALTGTFILSFIIFIIFVWLKKSNKTQNQKDIELFLKNNENLGPKRYKYKELKKITNSFKNSLGKGGYGSVYEGKLKDGRLVAVKILNESKGNGEDFLNEVASICRTSHVNIVSLLGYCYDGSKRALLYEFMPNGSLEKYTSSTTTSSEKDHLGLNTLFEIVVGIARGLEYLHRGCNMQILHFDIKPHNILLDKDLNPKISDFGLAKLCPNGSSKVSMLMARGTVGYIAPEVFSRTYGQVSHKSDVYSYGMMVLELIDQRQNNQVENDRSSEVYFPDFIYKELETNVVNGGLDGILNEDDCQYMKKKLVIVSLWCTQNDPKARPSMNKVLEMLEGKLESLEVPPKPYFTSSSIQKFSPLESLYSTN